MLQRGMRIPSQVRCGLEHIKQQKSSLVSLFPGDIAPGPNVMTKWANLIEFMQSMLLVAIEIPDSTCLSHSPVNLNSPNLPAVSSQCLL